jgi:transcriptional regulator with XRE-family HTH domain
MTGADVHAFRVSRGWTQARLARELGTDPGTVSRWERGAAAPRPSARRRLAALATGDDLSELIHSLGAGPAEVLLRRALLVQRTLPHPTFAEEPGARLERLDRMAREQADLVRRMVTPERQPH